MELVNNSFCLSRMDASQEFCEWIKEIDPAWLEYKYFSRRFYLLSSAPPENGEDLHDPSFWEEKIRGRMASLTAPPKPSGPKRRRYQK